MGSVIKRGKVWYIKYELPRGTDGKRQMKMRACPGMTKKEAEIELAEVERTIRRGEHTTTIHTVASFFQEWLSHARPSLAISTAAMYSYVVNSHIAPELGNVKLKCLTPLQIQQFYKRLQDGGHDRRSLSSKSVKNIHGLLHKALSQAVRWGLLPNNPADKVEVPKPEKANIQAINAEDLQRLLSALDTTDVWRLPILLALFTGMRRGEVLALQWQDYDPQIHTLAICRALSEYVGPITVKSTKTDRARVILLPGALVEVLDAHAKESGQYLPTDFICRGTDGRTLSPKHFSKKFTQVAHKLELPITLHGLRHSHATMLIAAGVPVKVVSERLGHADVNITQNVYAHVLPHMQQQAVDALEGLKTGPSEGSG